MLSNSRPSRLSTERRIGRILEVKRKIRLGPVRPECSEGSLTLPKHIAEKSGHLLRAWYASFDQCCLRLWLQTSIQQKFSLLSDAPANMQLALCGRQHREKLSSFANCLAADAQHPTFQVVSSKASTQPGSGAASDRRQS